MSNPLSFQELIIGQQLRITHKDRKGREKVFVGEVIKLDMHHKLRRVHIQTSAGTAWFVECAAVRVELTTVTGSQKFSQEQAAHRSAAIKDQRDARRIERAKQYQPRQAVWAFSSQLGQWYQTYVVRVSPNGKIVVLSAKMLSSVAGLNLSTEDQAWAQAILSRTHLVATDPRNVSDHKPAY